MLVAKKILTSSPLSIIKSTTRPAGTEPAYKFHVPIKIPAKETKPDLDNLPFEKWNIPHEEEGYIKGRENDFL